ncbi:MAG: hypothetical protein MJ048_03630 [Acidaminococcaceae bacterium]|nr:hypothetical protein [Acidaminococcaceae bacterium]
MKKFFLGFLSGILISAASIMSFGFFYANDSKRPPEEMIGFTKIENGESIACKQIKIFQVLKSNAALAYLHKSSELYDYNVVLLIGCDGDNFYDEQKIPVTNGKTVRRIGTYTYHTKEMQKTVPAVKIY